MIINDLDGYYIVFDTKNWNTELDTLEKWFILVHFTKSLFLFFFVAYRAASILALASSTSELLMELR